MSRYSLISEKDKPYWINPENGVHDDTRPVEGGQRAGFRTDLQLLNALFAA